MSNPLIPEDLQPNSASQGPIPKRIHPRGQGGSKPVRFAQVSTALSLLIGTPVAWNEALDAYVAWDPNTGASSNANEVQTLSDSGTVSGGTFTLTFLGQTTAAIAYDAIASAVETALDLLSTVPTGAISVSGGALPGTDVVFTFDGAAFIDTDVPILVVDDALLTGTTPAFTIVETTEGTPGTGAPAGQIIGFVYPETVDLVTTGDIHGIVMLRGQIHQGDVVLPTTGAPTQGQLDSALRSLFTTSGGSLDIQGLAGVH